MRLVQKAAEKHSRHFDQSGVGQDGGHQRGHAGYEEAPWMGHGGVHHMDPGHIGECNAACLYVMLCTAEGLFVEKLYIVQMLMLQSAVCPHSHCTTPLAQSMHSS